MLGNHMYNLIMQLAEESKSLVRIKEYYAKDSDCGDCKKFWEKMMADKEDHVKELEAMLKKHL